MKFRVLGLNFKNTPIELREKIHFYEKEKIQFHSHFIDTILKEAVILSTCNRMEIYFIAEDLDFAEEKIIDYLNENFNVELTRENLIRKTGDEALRYLFNTAIGLESLIVGEDQILGQIIEAQILGMELESSKKYLNKIFREAITFAKWTKTQSSASNIPISMSYMGVRKIEEEMDISNKKALIVGVGEMGQLAAKYLLERGANVKVCNRTYSNSEKLAEELGGLEICHYEDLKEEISKSDILISATASPHTIINAFTISERTSILYIMDLGLPRDVDNQVGLLDFVKLYDIDSLKEMSDQNLKKKKDILEKFTPEIDTRIEEIKTWWDRSKVDGIMKSARERCQEIADKTINYINRKTNLNHQEEKKVEMIVRSSIKRAMEEPLLALKNLEDSEEKNIAIKVMEEVFKN